MKKEKREGPEERGNPFFFFSCPQAPHLCLASLGNSLCFWVIDLTALPFESCPQSLSPGLPFDQ